MRLTRLKKPTPFWHEMFKIASVSGAEPQTPLGELTTLPRPPSRNGLLAFGNRSFAPSALALSPTRTYSLVYLRNFRLSYFPQPRSASDAIDHAQRLKPPKTKNPSYVAVLGGQVQEVLVLVLVLGGQVLVLVLGGQVLVNIPAF